MPAGVYLRPTPVQRFWSRVNKLGPVHPILKTRCWLWAGRVCEGYGQFQVGKSNINAHRFSWQIHFGPIGNLNVCHLCDIMLCVNPEHLFRGTQQDNMLDMIAKDRSLKGERNAAAKLTEADVLAIRARYKQTSPNSSNKHELAAEFGISHYHVHQIVSRRCWRHI